MKPFDLEYVSSRLMLRQKTPLIYAFEYKSTAFLSTIFYYVFVEAIIQWVPQKPVSSTKWQATW